MWLLTAVAAAAFAGNLGAEIMAEGVADMTVQMYWDLFWSFDPNQTMVDATKEFDNIEAMIAEAERRSFQTPPSMALVQR